MLRINNLINTNRPTIVWEGQCTNGVSTDDYRIVLGKHGSFTVERLVTHDAMHNSVWRVTSDPAEELKILTMMLTECIQEIGGRVK